LLPTLRCFRPHSGIALELQVITGQLDRRRSRINGVFPTYPSMPEYVALM